MVYQKWAGVFMLQFMVYKSSSIFHDIDRG